MRTLLLLATAALALCAVAPAAASGSGSGGKIRTAVFVSDADWRVYTELPKRAIKRGPTFLGTAQLVCPNATSPPSCPPGAVLYGWTGTGAWSADLTAIPGAAWIWAPGVTGSTSPAELARYVFAAHVFLPRRAVPTAAEIFVSADDFAAVYVNGAFVGSVGSLTDPALSTTAQNALTRFDITSFVRRGPNVVAVIGQNGPPFFASCSAPCTYAQHPAGVVFGGSIDFMKRKKP
jgi:hypothetical protein